MSKCLRETVNIKQLKHLIKHSDLYIIKEERKKFNSYAQLMLEGNGTKITQYVQANYKKGRLYAVGSMSIQGFSKNIRNLLARGLYHDIDMVNCHPVFLLNLCKKHNWKCQELKYYINNREQVLQNIMDFTFETFIILEYLQQ